MNFLLINFFLISLLLVTTFFIFKTTSLISVVALTGAFTLLCSAIYVNLDAVDVAFTEAAVGSGISTILMVMAAAKLPEGKNNKLINPMNRHSKVSAKKASKRVFNIERFEFEELSLPITKNISHCAAIFFTALCLFVVA